MSSQELKQYYAELNPRHSAAGEVAMYYQEVERYAGNLPLTRLTGEELLLEAINRIVAKPKISYDFSSSERQDNALRTINGVLNRHPYLDRNHEDALDNLWNAYRQDGTKFREGLARLQGSLLE